MNDKKVREITDGAYTVRFNENGEEIARFSMTEKGGEAAVLYAQPNKAIPIVFVPGIMGTPLVATGKDSPISMAHHQWAWFPDSAMWMAGIPLFRTGFRSLTPVQRSLMLKKDKTRPPLYDEADLRGLHQSSYKMRNDTLPENECRKRGWGTVLLGDHGYGDFLNYLDTVLNNIYHGGNITPQWKDRVVKINSILSKNNVPDLIDHLDDDKAEITWDDINELSEWYFPVYAAGYNWLESNDVSAKKLSSHIQNILQDCRNRLGFECDKVILVTHSMGGLVARMCAKKYSSDVMGIIHGVLPVNGSGTAYHRIVSGWDNDGGVGIIFGTDAASLTPMFSNPGPL